MARRSLREIFEEQIEQDLKRSSEMLLSGEIDPRLLQALQKEFGQPQQAFLLNAIPEQYEDIYEVAVYPDIVATVEVPRDPTEPIPTIERIPFEQYRRNRSSKEIRRALPIIIRLWRANREQHLADDFSQCPL